MDILALEGRAVETGQLGLLNLAVTCGDGCAELYTNSVFLFLNMGESHDGRGITHIFWQIQREWWPLPGIILGGMC